MKKTILLYILFFYIYSFSAQENEKLSLLKNTKNWDREIIKFPISWAPNLKVNGFEELLFMPKRADPKSDEFWSLVIAWKIEAKKPLSKIEIEGNLKSYFDGLMKPNHWSADFPEPKVNFTRNKGQNSDINFIGKMTFFDGFYTGKVIDVNLLIEQYFCKKQQETILIYRVSNKNFNEKVWQELNEITLNNNCN
ncbi:MAG: hypothetical protein NWQ17_08975 [Polaribacter sp.]|nr:hypothetical protein [Polaribacter sp.]